MSKIFFHSDGTPSPHPVDKESARQLRKTKYNDRIVCPVCGECSIKFTVNDRCIHCARIEAMHFYNIVVLGVPPTENIPITEDMLAAKAAYHASEYFAHPKSPAEAVEKNSPVWLRIEPCSKAGHLGLRSVNGGCWFCESHDSTPSPRQAARQAGEKWYTPIKPCPKCGTLEPRRVDNGECRGCIPRSETTLEREATAAMVRDCPDMVMSRKDARALDLKVYRTGNPCINGHTGYRYVSTGGCLGCLGTTEC